MWLGLWNGQCPSPKGLNTLFGYLGYYRRFIPEFAKLTAEMSSQ